ncbi:DUF6226 family protein [Microbacterium sp. NPDC055903]
MTEYIRPPIEPREFVDEAGTVIDFGNRWAHLGGTPPEDSYSVDEHLERFAPLHTIGEALIAFLAARYDVEVEEGLHVMAGLQHAPASEDVVRAVRLTPRNATSASLVIILTAFPGVRLYAGALYSAAYPSCGCNACDERWNEAADELEWQVFAIVGGGFSEEVSEPRRAKWSYDRGHGFTKGMGQTVSYTLRALDGSTEISGRSRAEDLPADVLRDARGTLDAVHAAAADHHWQPWQ